MNKVKSNERIPSEIGYYKTIDSYNNEGETYFDGHWHSTSGHPIAFWFDDVVKEKIDYTPGPWIVTKSSLKSTAIAKEEDNSIIAIVADWRKEKAHNANLIAAAPKMYEALKNLVKWQTGTINHYRALKDAEEAIEMATNDNNPQTKTP